MENNIPPPQPQDGPPPVNPAVHNFAPLRKRRAPAPLILAGIATLIGIGTAALFTFLTPEGPAPSQAATASVTQPSAPDTAKGSLYGQTPQGMIASRNHIGPEPSRDTQGNPQNANLDHHLISLASSDQSSEDGIMNSHPQPTWATSSTDPQRATDTTPIDHAPRVAVIYDADGRPTLTEHREYDVPAIGEQSPREIAEAIVREAKKNYLQAAAAAQGPGAFASRDASAMVMPDIESTPAPVTIPAGSRIPAVLDNAVDSDLQGPTRAHIVSDVCDPRTGAVAIPRGSWLLGNQGGGIINGERHLGIVWLRLTYPDLSSRMLIATDTLDNEGHTGIAGRANITKFAQFRDSFTTNIAASAGQIASSALAPRIKGNPAVVVDSGTVQRGIAPEQQVQSWTVARNTAFLLYLERDFDRQAPYHGERCE